ncbi:hypothetical protein IGS68_17690 [Skermanella sp. TT6]|uniref:Uncharacterized protein n=1 Tax=Skermanella cutis TaxID=2775420 RepID=A0ABX7B5W3_9PROT|nr:hypothetical protein [Skermanella sp. TT6]QQP87901.1 hypothetical protein IGS68_17690 [Skermanella sp. TT6]
MLCDCYLNALYANEWSFERQEIGGEWFEFPVDAPLRRYRYRTVAHFVARWENSRYRLDRTSIPRICMIIDWWDAALDRPSDSVG